MPTDGFYTASVDQVVVLTPQDGFGDAGSHASSRYKGLNADYFSPTGEFTEFRASGSKVNAQYVIGKEWSGAPYSQDLDYNVLPALCSMALKTAELVAGVWACAPSATQRNLITFFGVVAGEVGGAAYGYDNAFLDEFTLSFTRSECKATGKFMAGRETPGATLAAADTTYDIVPVVPDTIDLYYADSLAGLVAGGTKISGDGFSAEISFSRLRNAVWPLDSALPSYAGVVETAIAATAKFAVEASVEGADYKVLPFTVAKMRAGETIYLRIQATGPTIDSVPYSLTVDLALQISKTPTHSDRDGVFTAEWECGSVESADQFVLIAVQNGVTSL